MNFQSFGAEPIDRSRVIVLRELIQDRSSVGMTFVGHDAAAPKLTPKRGLNHPVKHFEASSR